MTGANQVSEVAECRCQSIVVIQISAVVVTHHPNSVGVKKRGKIALYRMLTRVIRRGVYKTVQRWGSRNRIVHIPVTVRLSPGWAWVLHAHALEVK